VKETVVYVVTITTRDAVIREDWFKCEREADNKSDRYMLAMKKDEYSMAICHEKYLKLAE